MSYVENAAPVVSRHSTMLAPSPPSASRLLRVEHAVAEAFDVVAGAMMEGAAEAQFAVAA